LSRDCDPQPVDSDGDQTQADGKGERVNEGETSATSGEAATWPSSQPDANGKVPAGSPAGDSPDPRAVLTAIRDVLLDAIEDPDVLRRMTAAETVVEIRLTDTAQTLTLMLDREPIEAVDHEVPDAEVHLSITSDDLRRVLSGEVHLPVLILRGKASYSGPVRKFLRVVPIISTMSDLYRTPRSEDTWHPGQGDPGAGDRSPGAGPGGART
jgi:hypothetical protein